jgi:uncharacterized protein YegJ (DUF2314 family)
MPVLRVLVVFLVGCSLAQAQSLTKKVEQGEIAVMADEDPAMRGAFEKARASLDEFLKKAKAPSADTNNYALKVGIKDAQGNTEYFWIGDFVEKDGRFTGVINNEPRVVKTVRSGQSYSFPRSHIVDWTYIDTKERRMYGNFTACALMTKEPPAEAEALKKRFGLQCD